MKKITFIGVILFSALAVFSQNFGIGISSPTEKLDVNGNIRASGYVLVPNRPAFSVYLSSHHPSTGVLVYGGVNNNNGSHYNTSNGRFTAPVSGLYQFTFGGIKYNGSPGSVARMNLRLNGSTLNPQARASEGANYGWASVTTVIWMNAGQYVDTYSSGDTGWYVTYTFFTGHLL